FLTSVPIPNVQTEKATEMVECGVSRLVKRRYTEVGTPDNRIIVVFNQVLMPRTKTSKPVLDP
ncbi:MAG: hypothetical protein KAU38_09575, partial [Desulfobacterales bacterium]|nr:hypothetical protein [Desulfobacterales bacterium]